MLLNLLESFVDNVFRDTVSEPAIGSVLYCDLAFGLAAHSGIYIGDNTIVHLDGDGIVKPTSPEEFLDRLDGLNTAISIYASCNDVTPVGCETVALRAISAIGNERNYNLLFDNCHQFTTGCLTGDFDNNASNFLWMLKMKAESYIDADSWRVWK